MSAFARLETPISSQTWVLHNFFCCLFEKQLELDNGSSLGFCGSISLELPKVRAGQPTLAPPTGPGSGRAHHGGSNAVSRYNALPYTIRSKKHANGTRNPDLAPQYAVMDHPAEKVQQCKPANLDAAAHVVSSPSGLSGPNRHLGAP